MDGSGAVTEYKDIILFLVTAAIIVPLFRQVRLSPILGFLAAGIALGPYGLATLADDIPWLAYISISDSASVEELAELGVVFLLFTIGLELSWDRIRVMYRLIFGLGVAQVAICGLVIGGAAMLLGQHLAAAFAIGAALAMSSTAIIMPLLEASGRADTPAGRTTFAILLLQDMAVAPILVTLGIISQRLDALSPRLLLAFLPAAAGLALVVLAARFVLRPLLRIVARTRSDEAFVAASLLVVIGAGILSTLAGLSMALGAFIAGLLLAESEFRPQVEVTVEPFKNLLLGLFFLSIGSTLDLSRLAHQPVLIPAITLGLMLLNGAVVFVLARLFRLARRQALEAALLLAAAGEFAFVVLTKAMADGIVPAEVGQSVMVAATLSMLCVPLLSAIGAGLGGEDGDLVEEPPGGTGTAEGAVLIVGYGRVGRLAGEMLARHGIAWVAADRDMRLVENGRHAGHPVWFGDAARADFLRHIGLETARAVIVTLDDARGAETIVACARQMRPDVPVVARARDAAHARRLYRLGATDVVLETIDASLQLSAAALRGVGVPSAAISESVEDRRDLVQRELREPAAG